MSGVQAGINMLVTQTRLWLAGFGDALRFHRCAIFFVYDSRILVKTLNCFLLNGVIFLGSLLLLDYVLLPTARALAAPLLGPAATDALSTALVGGYNLLWLLPAYAISFLVNCIWYSEFAELVVAAGQRRLVQQRAEREGVVLPASDQVIKVTRPDTVTFLSQEAYRMLLTAVLFAQVSAAGLLPFIGRGAWFVGMCWLYALYCFDYKWGLHGVPLEPRLHFFETHWAYFAGFGAVTVLPMLIGSFYTGAAVVGVLFPLFIMLACDASPKQRFDEVMAITPGPHRPVRLPVFWGATRTANYIIDQVGPRLAAAFGRGRHRQQQGRQQQQQGQQQGQGQQRTR